MRAVQYSGRHQTSPFFFLCAGNTCWDYEWNKAMHARKAPQSIRIYEVLTVRMLTVLLAQAFPLNTVTNKEEHCMLNIFEIFSLCYKTILIKR